MALKSGDWSLIAGGWGALLSTLLLVRAMWHDRPGVRVDPYFVTRHKLHLPGGSIDDHRSLVIRVVCERAKPVTIQAVGTVGDDGSRRQLPGAIFKLPIKLEYGDAFEIEADWPSDRPPPKRFWAADTLDHYYVRRRSTFAYRASQPLRAAHERLRLGKRSAPTRARVVGASRQPQQSSEPNQS